MQWTVTWGDGVWEIGSGGDLVEQVGGHTAAWSVLRRADELAGEVLAWVHDDSGGYVGEGRSR